MPSLSLVGLITHPFFFFLNNSIINFFLGFKNSNLFKICLLFVSTSSSLHDLFLAEGQLFAPGGLDPYPSIIYFFQNSCVIKATILLGYFNLFGSFHILSPVLSLCHVLVLFPCAKNHVKYHCTGCCCKRFKFKPCSVSSEIYQ